MSEISVTVDRVCYPPETTEGAKWFILSVLWDGSTQTAKGSMGWRAKANERLKLVGEWSSYQGKREFKFTSALLDLPTDERSLLHYACEMTLGIGNKLEEQIWERYGDLWSDAVEGAFPRFSGPVYLAFQESIERVEEDREKGAAISELMAKGATMNLASAAWDCWKEETLGVVASDPYILTELPNYGFADIDMRIRKEYGIDDNDDRRVRAAILYAMKQLTSSGSTRIDFSVLLREVNGYIGYGNERIVQGVRWLMEKEKLFGWQKTGELALASHWRSEHVIWKYLKG